MSWFCLSCGHAVSAEPSPAVPSGNAPVRRMVVKSVRLLTPTASHAGQPNGTSGGGGGDGGGKSTGLPQIGRIAESAA